MVIHETENDDLTAVMQELIETYADDIADVAVNLCVRLVRYQLSVATPLLNAVYMYMMLFVMTS